MKKKKKIQRQNLILRLASNSLLFVCFFFLLLLCRCCMSYGNIDFGPKPKAIHEIFKSVLFSSSYFLSFFVVFFDYFIHRDFLFRLSFQAYILHVLVIWCLNNFRLAISFCCVSFVSVYEFYYCKCLCVCECYLCYCCFRPR